MNKEYHLKIVEAVKDRTVYETIVPKENIEKILKILGFNKEHQKILLEDE